MMMKKIIILILCLNFSCPLFAETLILKSGKRVEGKIITQTDEYIKIDFYGIPITYYRDDIARIETEETTSVQPQIQPIPPIRPTNKILEGSHGFQKYKSPLVSNATDAKSFNSWYAGVKEYLDNASRIILEASQAIQQMFVLVNQAKMSKNQQLLKAVLNKGESQFALYINKLNALSPPPELRNFHNLFRKSLDSRRAMFSAGIQENPNNVLKYNEESKRYMMDSYRELRKVYVQHNAPREVVASIDNLMLMLDNISGHR